MNFNAAAHTLPTWEVFKACTQATCLPILTMSKLSLGIPINFLSQISTSASGSSTAVVRLHRRPHGHHPRCLTLTYSNDCQPHCWSNHLKSSCKRSPSITKRAKWMYGLIVNGTWQDRKHKIKIQYFHVSLKF